MISFEQAELVQRLLDEGDLSHRGIAKRVGVGRATVDRLARGEGTSLAERLRRPLPESPPDMLCVARCPECGALVAPPCVACRTRRYVREARAAA
ncbi:MAG: hypothetical protein ACRCT8_08865 [Lacipirellulaceae bacterium]